MSTKPKITFKGDEVVKVSNTGMAVSRLQKGESGLGFTNFRNIEDYVAKEMVSALKWPKCLETYDKMDYDHDVVLGRYLTQMFIEKAFAEVCVKSKSKSSASLEAAEFIKWNLNNMDHTFLEAIRNSYSFKKYGFSVLVKNYENITTGKYEGKYDYKLKRLSPRAQQTLDHSSPFIMGEDGAVLYARQNLTSAKSRISTFEYPKLAQYDNMGKSHVDIPRNKFMLFSYDSVNGNPLGSSPYKQAYRPWKEKTLVSDYEVIGASKDMGGVPILTAPSMVLERAVNDPSSVEGQMISALQSTLAEWHAGRSASMVLPSDIADNSTTQKQFDIKLQGVEGGGKNYRTAEIISDRQKAILNCFGAAFILLGQSGSGSYALADNQKGLHAFFVEKDINFICEVFNKELIPQLLAINEIRLEDEDMPVLEPYKIDEKDIDLLSKGIQRIAAVGMLPMRGEIINEILDDMGYEYRIPEDIITDEEKWEEWAEVYMTQFVSRSGDGMTEGLPSGTGDAVDDEDNDASNMDS